MAGSRRTAHTALGFTVALGLLLCGFLLVSRNQTLDPAVDRSTLITHLQSRQHQLNKLVRVHQDQMSAQSATAAEPTRPRAPVERISTECEWKQEPELVGLCMVLERRAGIETATACADHCCHQDVSLVLALTF